MEAAMQFETVVEILNSSIERRTMQRGSPRGNPDSKTTESKEQSAEVAN